MTYIQGSNGQGIWVNLHETMWFFDQCPEPVRAALNDANLKWGVQSATDFMIANDLQPADFAEGLRRINERSQWRYEAAAMQGFPPGWERWPPPAQRPAPPKRV